MPNDNEMLIKVVYDDSQAVQGTQRTVKAIKDVNKESEKTTGILGMSRREWMRTGSEATFYLRSVIGESSKLGQALGGAIGFATQLGESFAYGGAFGAGLAIVTTGLGYLSKSLFEASPEVQELNKELTRLADTGKTAETLSKIAGTTRTQAEKALIAAGASKEYANQLLRLQEAASQSQLDRDMGDVAKYTQGAWDDLASWFGRKFPDINGYLKKGTGDAESLRKAVQDTAPALIDQSHAMDVAKNGVTSAAKEIQSYNKKLDDMATAHKKAQSGFATDWAKAETNAARDVQKIRESLSARLADMDYNESRRQQDIAHNRALQEAEYSKSRVEAEQDAADAIAGIRGNLSESLQRLEEDSAEQEAGAKSMSELRRIQRDTQRRREDLQKQANEGIQAANDKRDKTLSDLEEKKKARDAEFAYNEARAQEELARNRQRAKDDADNSIAERQRQLGEEKKAIDERRKEEALTYNQNRTQAIIDHKEKMKDLFDTRTEVQKLGDDWIVVRDNIDAATAAIVNQQMINAGVYGTSGSTGAQSNWAQGEKFANGGTFVVGGRGGTDSQLVKFRATPGERVTVTPQGKSSGGHTVNINAPVYGVNDLQSAIISALDRADRGLN